MAVSKLNQDLALWASFFFVILCAGLLMLIICIFRKHILLKKVQLISVRMNGGKSCCQKNQHLISTNRNQLCADNFQLKCNSRLNTIPNCIENQITRPSVRRADIISEIECPRRSTDPCCPDNVNYGKIRDAKNRTQLYSYDFLSRRSSICKNLVRDPNEFYYLDKLYDSTSSSGSSTRARICAHPAPLPDIKPRSMTSSFLSSNCSPVGRSNTTTGSPVAKSQVKFLDDHRIDVDYCCDRPTLTLPPNVSLSAGDLCQTKYAPYTNYLEIGKKSKKKPMGDDKSVMLLFNNKSSVMYSISKSATNENHLLDIQFDERGYPIY